MSSITSDRPRAGLWGLWTSLPRPAQALLLARMVNRVGGFSMAFLAVLMTDRLGTSVATAGAVVATFGVMTIPSRLAGGALLDRIGARPTILWGLVGCAIAQLVLAAANGVAMAVVGALLLGLAYELIEPPTQAMIADVSDHQTRPALFGLLFASMTVAAVLAGGVAALVAGIDLRLLFVIDALTCMACAAVVVVFLPRGRRQVPGAEASVAGPWRDRRLWLVGVSGILFTTVYMIAVIGQPVTVSERGVGLWVVGVTTVVAAVVAIASQRLLRLGWLNAHWGFRAMAMGYLIMGAGFAVVAFSHSPTPFLVGGALMSVAEVLLMGHLYAVVSGLAPDQARGRYLAVFGLTWGVATIAAPLVVGWLLPLNGHWLWLGGAVVCVLLAAWQPMLSRLLRLPDPA